MKKLDEEEDDLSHDKIFKHGIKSRRTLTLAINDKSQPRATKNLKIIMNLVIISLICIAITEFATINNQFTDIDENFNLIELSYGRISEI